MSVGTCPASQPLIEKYRRERNKAKRWLKMQIQMYGNGVKEMVLYASNQVLAQAKAKK